MKSWKKTIGTAFSSAGTMMVGVGVVPQLGTTSNQILTVIALVGFAFNVAGAFLTHLFVEEQSEMIRTSQMSQTPVPQPEPKP